MSRFIVLMYILLLLILVNSEKVYVYSNTYKSLISEGFLLYKLGEYNKSIKVFSEASEINTQDPLPYRMIGLCYYKKNDFTNAAIFLSQSLLLENDENLITLSILGNIYFKLKKYYNASLVYERLSNLTNDAFVHYRLMKSLGEIGKVEEAIKYGEKYLIAFQKWDNFRKEIFLSELRKLYLKLSQELKKDDKKDEYEKIMKRVSELK